MKSRLFFKSLLFVALFLSAFGGQKAYADHISSADMFVDYIGTGPNDMKYRVTVVFYRICIGNNLALSSTAYTVTASSASLGWSKGLTPFNVSHYDPVYNQTVVEDTLDNLCPAFSAINSCRVLANTSYSGYTRRIYTDTVTVPGRSADLKFTWSSCCRLLSYTNINYGAGPSFYMEVGINNLIRYNNNSPRYNGQPFTFVCTNQPSSFSNIPSDPDGDSLVTYRIDPQQSATTNIVYNAGYTSANPTGTTAPAYYTVSPISGKASFIALASGKYALGFRTEDWDKATHQRLGYVSRDLTISVLPCTNLPPYIDSIPQGVTGVKRVDTTNGDVVLTACPQSPLSFVVNAHSNNANGLIYMRPSSTLPPGMTVAPTVTGGTGYVTVNWTPTAADIGTHVVSILAVDSTCAVGQEITLRNEFTFTVDVRPGLDAGPDLLSCPLGERPVSLGTNANPNSTITWTNLNGAPAQYLSCNPCANPYAGPPMNYTYVVTTNDPAYACKNSDTLTVFIDTSNSIQTPQDLLIVCRPGYRQLLSNAIGLAPLANLPCGTANPLSCTVSTQDTATMGQGTNPPVDRTNTPFYSEKTYIKYQFLIPKRDMLNAGFYSGTINSMAFLNINPTILGASPVTNMIISFACLYDQDFTTPISNSSFFSGAQQVASVASYTLTPNDWNTITLDNPYSWDTTTNLLVDICVGPLATPNPSGADPFAMTPGRAIQKSDNGINVCGGNAPTVQSFNQRPVVRFIYCPSPSLPFNYTWIPGTFLNDSTQQNPTAFIPHSMDYAVYTIGRNGCKVRDSLHILIPEHHLFIGPMDSVACVGQPVPLFASGGTAYQWYEVQGGVFTTANSLSCTNCSNPVATPPSTTHYAVVYSNDIDRGNPLNPGSSDGCPDTLYTSVIINPLPLVHSSNRDTTIAYGKSLQLFATGATHYTWTPVGSLSDPNSPAPMASPKQTTTYIVSGMDSNGCVARDTVLVNVDYTNHLLIPSGFTPNNDGINDVFHIVNPSFQKLLEFRVFNRWGQEVFSTTDINGGWDGKWKGVEQPIGTYQYLIRVGTQDGNLDTYKGSVNLIR